MTTAKLQTAVPLRADASIMGLVGLAHACSHFSHLLLPVMFPVFIKEFGWSFSQLGLLSTTFFVVSGAGQALAGFVVDRLGARPVLWACMCFFVLACSLAALSETYAGMLGVAVLAGLGNCAFHPVDFTILNQRVSMPRLGYAFSVHGLSGNLGWAAAPLFLMGMTAWMDWRAAYWAAAFLYTAIFLLLLLGRGLLSTTSRPSLAPGESSESSFAFMRLPVVWWCFAFFFLSTMTLAVVQNFSVPILKALHGVSAQTATYTLSAYMLCGAVGMLVGGLVAARWPLASDKVVSICMAVAAVLMAACATGWFGGTGTLLVLSATGLAVGIGGPSRDLMIKRATPKGATGRVYGMVYSGLDSGFAVSPLIFGVLMDRGWYAATLLGAALVLLLSVFVAVGVGRRTSS